MVDDAVAGRDGAALMKFWTQVCAVHSRHSGNWQTVSRHDLLERAVEAAQAEVDTWGRVARVIDGDSGKTLWSHGTMKLARRRR